MTEPGLASERFTTRSYQEGDETAILDLFVRSFQQPRTREHFDWKYRRNPFGKERISVTLDEAGRLVGHYAGYPVPFRDGGGDLVAHQIGDTMTDKSVRHIGRGSTSILGKTARHFYETFCEGKVAFNFGFNVANIQKFSLRFLRSERVEPVAYRVRDLRTDPITPISRWNRYVSGYRLELVRDLGAEWDAFFDRVAPSYRFLARRDARYIRWRYLECPDISYFVVAIRKWRRLAGWIAFRIRDRRFTLGDALFDPRFGDAPGVLLRHVVPSYPVDLVEAWFPSRPGWFDAVLQQLRFETRPEPQELSVMCVPFTRSDAAAHMRQALYYTMADSDLF